MGVDRLCRQSLLSGSVDEAGVAANDAGFSAMEGVMGVGPCPRGLYSIGPWHDHHHLGPCVALLTPVGHDALGRTALFIHGDNTAMNKTVSDGCIILGPSLRHAMRDDGDTSLQVI